MDGAGHGLAGLPLLLARNPFVPLEAGFIVASGVQHGLLLLLLPIYFAVLPSHFGMVLHAGRNGALAAKELEKNAATLRRLWRLDVEAAIPPKLLAKVDRHFATLRESHRMAAQGHPGRMGPRRMDRWVSDPLRIFVGTSDMTHAATFTTPWHPTVVVIDRDPVGDAMGQFVLLHEVGHIVGGNEATAGRRRVAIWSAAAASAGIAVALPNPVLFATTLASLTALAFIDRKLATSLAELDADRCAFEALPEARSQAIIRDLADSWTDYLTFRHPGSEKGKRPRLDSNDLILAGRLWALKDQLDSARAAIAEPFIDHFRLLLARRLFAAVAAIPLLFVMGMLLTPDRLPQALLVAMALASPLLFVPIVAASEAKAAWRKVEAHLRAPSHPLPLGEISHASRP